MRKTKLIWSPIQLRLANKYKIVPISWLTRVPMNIDGVHSVTYFEFIYIVDGSQPYTTLKGIEWAFDN